MICIYIYTYSWHLVDFYDKCNVNVGKYTSPMDPIGNKGKNGNFRIMGFPFMDQGHRPAGRNFFEVMVCPQPFLLKKYRRASQIGSFPLSFGRNILKKTKTSVLKPTWWWNEGNPSYHFDAFSTSVSCHGQITGRRTWVVPCQVVLWKVVPWNQATTYQRDVAIAKSKGCGEPPKKLMDDPKRNSVVWIFVGPSGGKIFGWMNLFRNCWNTKSFHRKHCGSLWSLLR